MRSRGIASAQQLGEAIALLCGECRGSVNRAPDVVLEAGRMKVVARLSDGRIVLGTESAQCAESSSLCGPTTHGGFLRAGVIRLPMEEACPRVR